MSDFAFDFIFEISKDKCFTNSREFRGYLWNKYGIRDKSFGTKLYIAINNYQVKKYGKSLNPRGYNYSVEEYKEIAQRRRSIKWVKKNR